MQKILKVTTLPGCTRDLGKGQSGKIQKRVKEGLGSGEEAAVTRVSSSQGQEGAQRGGKKALKKWLGNLSRKKKRSGPTLQGQ